MDRNYPTAHAAINIYFGLKVTLKSDGPGVPYFKCMNDIDIHSWCTSMYIQTINLYPGYYNKLILLHVVQGACADLEGLWGSLGLFKPLGPL